MKKAVFILLLIALMVVGTTISAQDDGLASDAAPTFATINLGGDGWLDPFVISVNATNDVEGQSVDASALDESCAGFVSSTPSVVVNWQPTGDVPAMRVFFVSSFDPVLVVVKPDGSYACNDDFNGLTTNPLVEIEAPVAGEYRIHVGTFREASPFGPGFLVMTAGPATPDTFDVGSLVSAAAVRHQIERIPLSVLLLTRPPADESATADLTTGFEPVSAEVTGGGILPAFNLNLGNPTCTGFITALPTYTFTFTGEPQATRIYFEGDADSTIVVITQDGRVYCQDDAASDNLNPSAVVPLMNGRYAVYIGSSDPTTNVTGLLTITDDESAGPAVLSPADEAS